MKRLLVYLFIVLGLGLVFQNKSFTLESAKKINEKEKVKYLESNNTAYWQFMQLKMNDLRGDGIVYYLFDVDKYYRISENYKVVSKGNYKYKGKNVFELTEDNLKFFFKISISSQVIDIKSKFYDYKGYRRYQSVLAEINEQEQIKSSIKNYEDNKYVKVATNQNDIIDASFKSALDIDKKEKIRFLDHNAQIFWAYVFLIDDLRGNGPVYYFFTIDQYHRLDKNFNVISHGLYEFKGKEYKGNEIFELKEGKIKYLWKISLRDNVIDIKSKFYKYKGFKRYHFKQPTKVQIKNVKQSVKNFKENRYAGYDDSDDNLNRLYKIILGNKNIKSKYLKYSKKNASFDGKKIKTMGLAVFINYEKELSKLTKDIYLKEISSFAWGWEYSTKDQLYFDGYEAIKNCYQDVKKKKLSLRDGKCILVDFRRITGDWNVPVAWENYLIKEKENRMLLAKNKEQSFIKNFKSTQQLADKKKEKKDEETKKKQLLLAQKKAEEEKKRKAEEEKKRKAEEEKKRKAEEEKKRKAEEEKKRKAEEKRKADAQKEKENKELLASIKERLKKESKVAEEKNEEEERIAEQKKLKEEKKAEEVRIAEEARIAEEERKKKSKEKKITTNIYNKVEDYFPSVITEEKMNKDQGKEITIKKFTVNGISAWDKFGNNMDVQDIANNFEKNGKYMYIQQIAKDEKQNVYCRLSYEDSIKWLSWMNKKDESLLTAYSIADMGDWLESTGTADEKESMRFKTDIGLLKDKSWPEVYVKGKVMAYFDKRDGWSGLALRPCQFKEIEIEEEKKSTKKKDKKEKKEEASNISDLDKTLKLTMQKLMHKKLVYKNNDGVTCSLTFYKSGYLEISSNCSPLKKEYNYFNKYLFYTAGIEKQKVEGGEIELVGFQWFTLEGNEFFRNLFMVIPKLGFNPDGSPKFFTVTHGSEYGKSHGSLQKVVMEAQEINDISCDASTYTELAKCSLPKILEFCEVKDFEPLKSFQSRGIYKRGSGKTLFAYLFEDEVIGKNSFASISLKGCINKMNPIFGETPKYLNFDFYFPGSTPITGKHSHSGDVGEDWARDEELVGVEFIVADFGTVGFKGADVKDPKFNESIVRELNRKYDINLAELNEIYNFMTPKQLLQCNVRLWDSDRTVSCPKNYPDSFIAYYDNYKINLEIYYSMTTGPDPDNSLGMYPQARMIFTDDGDAIRKMSKRRFKVLQRLSGL